MQVECLPKTWGACVVLSNLLTFKFCNHQYSVAQFSAAFLVHFKAYLITVSYSNVFDKDIEFKKSHSSQQRSLKFGDVSFKLGSQLKPCFSITFKKLYEALLYMYSIKWLKN